VRDMPSRMFVNAGYLELLSLIHVRMNRPDKREVGSSTLPRPINSELVAPLWIRP
jgi:hypothetical protein